MLREYQIPACEMMKNYLTRKTGAGVVVAPTAAGKSWMIADVAKSVEKCLIFQPSKELLAQNFEKYSFTENHASIYSASFNSKNISDTTFATIGSVKDKGELFRGFKLIIDEAHLYPPASESMLGKFLTDSGIKNIVGLTATPFRLKKDTLKFITRTRPKIFSDIIHCIQVSEIVSRGFWSKMRYKHISLDERKLVLNSSGSDYTEKSMKAFYDANDIGSVINRIVNTVKEHGKRSILVFVPDVSQAHDVAGKIGGQVVWGNMPDKDRDRIIKGFKELTIPVVVNVNVLSVGFDHPLLDTIICARPTRSLAWYYQAIGRGTRIHPEKPECWVYDLTHNFNRFGRLENLVVEKFPGTGWEVFGTSDGRLLTNVPMGSDRIVTRKELSIQGRKAYGW